MKKIVIVLIILLIALMVGAPYITGKIAETETLNMVDMANQDPTVYGEIEVLSYDRGFGSTSAQYSYKPPAFLAALVNTGDPIEYSCESDHGVLGIDYECKLEGDSAYSAFVTEKLGGKDPFSMTGSVSAFGGITQTYQLEAIENLDLDGDIISTPKALISIETDQDMSSFKYNGNSDAFSYSDEEGSVDIGEMNFEGNLESVAKMVFTGPFKMSLDKFVVKHQDADFALNGLTMKSNSEAKGENIDTLANFKVASIKSNNGVADTIENLNADIEFNGIDIEALSAYQQFSMNMQREVLMAMESGKEPEIDPNMMLQALPIMESMLKPGLEINMAFDAELNGSDNSIAFKSSLLEALTFAQMALFMTAPEEALKKVDLSLQTDLSKSLIDSQPMAAGLMSQSPLVEQTSDSYKMSLALGKEIELNGKKLSFQELQGMIFGSMGM